MDGEVEKANTSKGNNTLDLTYTGSFIWSDPKRLVETKPGNLMAKDLNCLKAAVAVDVEQYVTAAMNTSTTSVIGAMNADQRQMLTTGSKNFSIDITSC